MNVDTKVAERLKRAEKVVGDFVPIVRAAQDVIAAWRIGNIYQDDWLRRLDAAFRDVPDERRAEIHAALAPTTHEVQIETDDGVVTLEKRDGALHLKPHPSTSQEVKG